MVSLKESFHQKDGHDSQADYRFDNLFVLGKSSALV